MAAEAIKRRKPSKPTAEKTSGTQKSKSKDKGQSALSINKYAALFCAGLLGFALFRILTSSPDNLVSQPFLPFVYPECCTGTEEQLTRLWGSYRPQVYFGMRPRIDESAIFGLMWMPVHPPEQTHRQHFRHTSEQNELRSFTWTRHDGNKFGVQTLRDHGYDIETSFVKSNVMLQDWSARIKVSGLNTPDTPRAITLFWYVGFEHSKSTVRISSLANGFGVHGETPELGKFHLRFKTVSGFQMVYSASICDENVELHRLTDYVKSRLRPVPYGRTMIPGIESMGCSERSNAVVMQITVPMEQEVEVVYENLNIERARNALEGAQYETTLAQYITEFDEKFEEKFQLKTKGYSQPYIDFAKSTFSNLIGGIGYFHGRSIVTSSQHKKPLYYWPASLFSAVPSRAFFPRGFLWDEGFHQLLISKWDSAISLEVLGHWLNLMNADGWIPREQILGNEALMKVPAEFVVQNADYANPPTLFLALDSMLNTMQPSEILDHHSTLKKMFHRLSLWYNWYNTTQTGPLPTTYRWRGRNSTTDRELNPKTLTSGLDDYPRATHPTDNEYHVDLRCWMAFASRALVTLGDFIGINVDKYQETADILSDNDKLRELHWTGSYFADYGLHSDVVGLQNTRVGPPERPQIEKRRVVRKLPQPQFVKVQGYLNLFPFILTILKPDSPELGATLKHLRSSGGIWSPFGICSVGKTDPYYLKYNTQHDAPYWRGPVWININYLTIRALDHYAKIPGPHAETCKSLYRELRTNIVNNIYKEYTRTGYIWEQYNCQTGEGQSVHPFTGWSSLVVLIMGEQY